MPLFGHSRRASVPNSRYMQPDMNGSMGAPNYQPRRASLSTQLPTNVVPMQPIDYSMQAYAGNSAYNAPAYSNRRFSSQHRRSGSVPVVGMGGMMEPNYTQPAMFPRYSASHRMNAGSRTVPVEIQVPVTVNMPLSSLSGGIQPADVAQAMRGARNVGRHMQSTHHRRNIIPQTIPTRVATNILAPVAMRTGKHMVRKPYRPHGRTLLA